MEVVRDAGAQGVVVADLTSLAEKAVVILGELAEADRAATRELAGGAGGAACRADVAVLGDEGLYEGVERRVGAAQRRNDQPSDRAEVRQIELRAECGGNLGVGNEVRSTTTRVLVVGEFRSGKALRIDDPRSLERSQLQLRIAAGTGRAGLDRIEGARRLGGVRVAIAAVEEDRRRRREGQLSELFLRLEAVRRKRAVVVRLQRPRVIGLVVRTIEEKAVTEDRAPEVDRAPGTILGEGQVLRPHLVGYEAVPEDLITDLAGELVRARLADRVDQEAAGAVEVDRLGAAFDHVDLGDVVRV